MIIYFATDHAGFELKEKLKTHVADVLGYEVVDCGATELVEGDDYPTYMKKAAAEVSARQHTARAIILGGSGQGEAMVANRFSHVRAAVYYGGNLDIVKLSREHNDANVLSLGARFLAPEEAIRAVTLWLETPFSELERHVRRIAQFDE